MFTQSKMSGLLKSMRLQHSKYCLAVLKLNCIHS